jgi:hypothetical protein
MSREGIRAPDVHYFIISKHVGIKQYRQLSDGLSGLCGCLFQSAAVLLPADRRGDEGTPVSCAQAVNYHHAHALNCRY